MDLPESTIERIKKLKSKYSSIGQDIDAYLDGLIYANPLKYWDYIEVETLLSLQKPKTDYPDEKIFIVYHQITELYFNLIQHEIDQICFNGKNISEDGQDLGWNKELSVTFFIERLNRINMYFKTLTDSFDIMRFGMEREQFKKFRMSLLSASGFQTASYRFIELSCTDVKYLVHEKHRAAMADKDMHQQLDHIYWREGAVVEETGEKTLTLRDFEDKYLGEFHEYLEKMQPVNIWRKYKSLPEADQKNPDLIKALRAVDIQVNVNWPLVHFRTAAHYLAMNQASDSAHEQEGKGTGGSNWRKYLPPHFQCRIFYPELWNKTELDEWGKSWVDEVFSDSLKKGREGSW